MTGEVETISARGPMDVRRVMAALPHRYPMLLIDRVVSLVPNQSIHAIKAVSVNEPFFQGHFPTRPIMPGVLAVESMNLADSGKLVYFMSIDGAKFRSPVEPGCLLDLHVEVTQNRGAICKFAGKAMLGDKLAAEAQFVAMISDPPKD
ncbi:MAG: 3-hydroxyacyl-ACP dehydratase FabZ [Alphaproteobacteria bacterium]|nr:3-hydroxyacyl-ACP dehydratase FabZ [Alphaproteobacteria bacterium]